MCKYSDCKTRPHYNIAGEKTALYCSLHKKEEMINVSSKPCAEEGCKILPTFNMEGEKKTLYCCIHKKEGMVDVKNKTCAEDGCKKLPNFNNAGDNSGVYCSIHKKEGMINVKDKTCAEEGCKTRPNFNFAGEKTALYCATHKKEKMIDVKSKPCIHDGCTTRPVFNLQGEKTALYCATHKKEGMVNVKNKTCKSEWCLTQVEGEKYNGYCLFCYMHLFPDKPVSRNYKTKEYSVVEYVKNKFPEFEWIADKIVHGGCSKRRPDLLLDLFYQIVIIEIDENQHADYDCSCENKRIMELSQDLGHRPIVFIRFNPDDYEKDGKNITSCWGQDKTGICVVKKSKQKEWSHRLTMLGEQIAYWTDPVNATTKTLEIIQLFY
jgi:hypothetical protein